jgi:hypothetical protein
MLYYILHSYTGAHLNVCVYALSGYSSLNALLHTSKITRVLTSMYALMSYQMALVTEFPITYITNMTALTSMYALMSYQMALVTECPITHITNMRALTSMYALMSLQIGL